MSKDFFERVGKEVAARPRRGAEVAGEAPTEARHLVSEGAKRSWAEADGNFWGTPQSHERLPTGIYRMDINASVGPMFIRQKNDTDDLVELPDSESAKILDEIRQFKTLRQSFREHGFLYKRGILMYGPPGSGKTCTLQLLLKMLVEEHDSIAVLALLDGESQINNVVYIATTNYPERLDRRFVDRPSRFDTIREIGMPTAAARRTYLLKKVTELQETPGALVDYVAASDGYSIAHLRELIILTRCFGATLEDAAARINGAREKKHSSDNFPPRKAIGFP